jgi:uncharacterized lipoprotein YajG
LKTSAVDEKNGESCTHRRCINRCPSRSSGITAAAASVNTPSRRASVHVTGADTRSGGSVSCAGRAEATSKLAANITPRW